MHGEYVMLQEVGGPTRTDTTQTDTSLSSYTFSPSFSFTRNTMHNRTGMPTQRRGEMGSAPIALRTSQLASADRHSHTHRHTDTHIPFLLPSTRCIFNLMVHFYPHGAF